MSEQERISAALEVAFAYGSIDGEHHKMWVIDQMVRSLLDCPVVRREAVDAHGKPYSYPALGESDAYLAWVAAHCDGEDGPNTYEWDEGITP